MLSLSHIIYKLKPNKNFSKNLRNLINILQTVYGKIMTPE